jgi:hypothetical protein
MALVSLSAQKSLCPPYCYLRFWVIVHYDYSVLRRYKFRTKFRENRSTGSEVEMRQNTHIQRCILGVLFF